MFVVICNTMGNDLIEALFTLSLYNVQFEARSNGENSNTTVLVVDKEGREGDLRLAEMAFQMGYHQKNRPVCPECYD